MRPRGNRSGWYSTNIVLPTTHRYNTQASRLMINPDGSGIFSITTDCNGSHTTIRCPSRPRLHHDPSMSDLPENEQDEANNTDKKSKRTNPCCLCKVNFFHGAMNFAIMNIGFHCLVMIYSIYVMLDSNLYVKSYSNFWGFNKLSENAMKHHLNVFHVGSTIVAISESVGLLLGLLLAYGIIKESSRVCVFWCVTSVIFSMLQIVGITVLVLMMSFVMLIATLLVFINAYGIWVIWTYTASLSDPKPCPVCHNLVDPDRINNNV